MNFERFCIVLVLKNWLFFWGAKLVFFDGLYGLFRFVQSNPSRHIPRPYQSNMRQEVCIKPLSTRYWCGRGLRRIAMILLGM